jgi:RNA polymerase sigma-70 factor (ECF subfamily)
LLETFLLAVQQGDLSQLQTMLDDDVRSVGDGGGKALAARRELSGKDEVLRLWGQLFKLKLPGPPPTTEIIELNGWPAGIIRIGDQPMAAIHIETDGKTIHAIRSTLNPDKLGFLRVSASQQRDPAQ